MFNKKYNSQPIENISDAIEAELFAITSGAVKRKFGANASFPSQYDEYEKSTGSEVLLRTSQQLKPAIFTVPLFVRYTFSGEIPK
jgi:hypothetical protein